MGHSHSETLARTQLDAWRECGADRLDPVRFRFIEALDRRAAGHVGEARRILDRRLAELLDAYATELRRSACKERDAGGSAAQCEPAGGALLARLVDDMASRAHASDDGPANDRVLPLAPGAQSEILDYFRKTWAKVRTEKQLRQSLEQVPRNAGPLNSSSLVHRSLSLMRELSPGYLQQFLAYSDTLSWMEQFNDASPVAGKDARRAGSTRKRGLTVRYALGRPPQ